MARGHLHSDVKDVKFDCEMGFDTKEFPIAFGELVPAVNFDVKNFTVDGKDSTLKITGFIIDFFENILVNIFRKKFMDVHATSVKYKIMTAYNYHINAELIKYGSKTKFDGITLDHSLTKDPILTNENLLTYFINGTFYNDAQNGAPVIHPSFSVGNETNQDVNFHLSESVVSSLLSSLQSHGALNMSKLYEQVYNRTLTYGDIATLNQYISTFRAADTPIVLELTLLDGADSVKFVENNIRGNFSIKMRFSDLDGTLITEYQVDGLEFNLQV